MSIKKAAIAALFLLAAAVSARSAVAETNSISIAHQFGLGYLPLYIMQEQHLIERHAKSLGLDEVSIRWSTIGSTAVMADGIISGNFDIASAGVPPFIILWDRTRSGLGVKMISALNTQPMKLNTNNPQIHSVRDFSDRDRIAVPAIKTSAHSILLGMAAEKQWGPGNHDRLETLQVPLSHPDAAAALLSGKLEITAHFSTIPYTSIELANPKVHTILTTDDILGGPATITAWWTTTKFHDANPKLYQALLLAAEDAIGFIDGNHRGAAEIYRKLTSSKMSVEEIQAILADPKVGFGLTPERTFMFADYMARAGLIHTRPESWKDLFFPEIYARPGS